VKISGVKPNNTVTMKTTDKKSAAEMSQWWLAGNDREVCNQLIATAAFLKENQQYRQRHTAVYARLYGNQSLFSFIGANVSKIDQSANALPLDRPTFNLVQSAVDTLISKISQSRPAPVFLTDNGDYRQRNLAKKLNNFILGEFYQTKAYDKAATMLRDCLVTGDGVLKVYRGPDNKVAIDRVLNTEILVDPNEAIYGEPRQMYQLKLVDRKVLMDQAPKYRKAIETAEKAFPDNSADSSKTVSDLVMVVEGWRLPSGPGAKDGRHTIACSSGIIFDEKWTKDKFPFVFLKYSSRLLGFWAQGLAEQLMGTQLEINSILYTISKSIRLVGVPRVFVEAGSKIVKAHLNNDVGAIVEYRGTPPTYSVAPCVPAEMYEQLQRLIDYGYRQSGVSSLDAGAQKPAGLNSGEAIRSYDDISNDRFNSLSRKYDNVFVDLAYQVIEQAQEIAEDTGSYSTVYPNKNGTKEIDLPEADLINDPFVIQCFNMSSLPRDPAGRKQTVTDMVQSGMITLKEGRRLLDYPDLEQIDKLDNASEERIFQILDKIIEEGEYTPPDSFMDLQLANDLAVKYYNLYSAAKLEPEKEQQLRDFFAQVQALKAASQPQPVPGMPAPGGVAAPQAAPEPVPTSPLVPNGVAQ
jgi:hypothetical protein